MLYAWFCTSAMCGDTVWLEILMGEILVGNLFWRIDSFESNPPIFLSAIFYSRMSSLRRRLKCLHESFKL